MKIIRKNACNQYMIVMLDATIDSSTSSARVAHNSPSSLIILLVILLHRHILLWHPRQQGDVHLGSPGTLLMM